MVFSFYIVYFQFFISSSSKVRYFYILQFAHRYSSFLKENKKISIMKSKLYCEKNSAVKLRFLYTLISTYTFILNRIMRT